MSESKDPLLLDHEADGIKELDNFLPHWWLWLFWVAILFGIVYMAYYHIFRVGPLSAEAYQQEMSAAEVQVAAVAAAEPPAAYGTKPGLDEATLAQGQLLFATHCVACHGQHGEGLVGPNFTDDYFLHGPEFVDSVRTITEGVPPKGMISWKPILKPNEIQAVASYVWTLRGTHPDNPKPPQGQQFSL